MFRVSHQLIAIMAFYGTQFFNWFFIVANINVIYMRERNVRHEMTKNKFWWTINTNEHGV